MDRCGRVGAGGRRRRLVGRAPARPAAAPDRAASGWRWLGAVALYGVATLVRGERWQRLLVDEGGDAQRDAYTQELNCVGYMGNNLLPARAGDAIRVVLMAPRAEARRCARVVGTLLAERLLDVGLLLVIFVIVGYGLLGEVGGGRSSIVLIAAGALAAAAGSPTCWCAATRRCIGFLAPIAVGDARAAPRAPRAAAARHDAADLGDRGRRVDGRRRGASASGWTPIEGLYIVALASIFSMIPSGPAYAGTQDAAAIIGIKALGGTGAQAVAYIVMLRFVIVVPITLVGLVLLVARYGGLGRLRTARAEARAELADAARGRRPRASARRAARAGS